MRRAVVDASVAVKWVTPETYSNLSLRLLNEAELFMPSHWLAEASTAVWAKCMVAKALTQDEASAAIQLLTDVVVEETPIRALLGPASVMAFDLHLTIYDTLYVALAARIGVPVVTADQKLFARAKADPRYAGLMIRVADLPAIGAAVSRP